MSPADYQRRKAVFEAALDAPSALRDGVIQDLCQDDAALAHDVRRLLRNAEAENAFLDAGAVPSRELAPGQLLCDRFELLRLAGEGGMGQVWAAHDRRLNETVAIKTIQRGPAAQAGGLDRLQRELQLARRIGHPHVCRVYELFDDPATSRVFLTMQFLQGETLAIRLRREGRLVPAEALRLFEQIAAGLAAAHSAGVVHRDLKPSNVMLTPDPATGQEKAVVMDFGLARAHQPSAAGELPATQTGLVVGTPEYMAPEQIRSEPATPAADVYALGLLLFEMLDGQPPFPGKNTMDAWMRRMREGPPPLAANQRVPGLDPRVDTVIARCLQYEPTARFASPTDAVAALGARPAPRWTQALRPQRSWLIAAAGAALAAVALWLGPRWFRPGVPDDIRRAYEDAQRDLSEGAAARAGAELRRTIQRAPNFAAAHAALAETQLELDQVYQARESIQRAAYLAPDRSRLPEADALHIDGINLLILRDCAKAVDTLRRRSAAVEPPLRATALASLARAYERCEMANDARRTLDEAIQADPRNAAVRVRAAYLASRRKDQATATRLLSEAEALYRERANFEGVAEVLATRGSLAAERDQLDEASTALSEAMSLAQTTRSIQQQVRVLLQQAIVARKRGSLPEAEQLTTQGVELAKRNDLETLAMEALFTTANIDFIKNEFARAETGFRQALEIATRYRDEANQAKAWLSLASLFLRQAEPARAEELLAKAQPYFDRFGNRRVLDQIEAIRDSLLQAKAHSASVLRKCQSQLREALAKSDAPGALVARRKLRGIYSEMGRWREAWEIAEQMPLSSSISVERGRDLLARAKILAPLGRSREALAAWREASRYGTGVEEYSVKVAHTGLIISLFSGMPENLISPETARPPSRMDATTQQYTDLFACTRAAWSPQPQAALPLCSQLLEKLDARGLRHLAILTKLNLAEALLRCGRRGEASLAAKAVRAATEDWGEDSEYRWRSQVIAALADRAPRDSFPLSPTLPWLRRPDVIQLLGVQ